MGVDSAYHTYIYETVENLNETLGERGDRGRMAKGLKAHSKVVKGGAGTYVLMSKLAQLPTLSRQIQHGPFRKNIKDGPKDDTNQLDGADAKLSVIPHDEALFVLDNLTLARF